MQIAYKHAAKICNIDPVLSLPFVSPLNPFQCELNTNYKYDMMSSAILNVLSKERFVPHVEKETQAQIELCFQKNGIAFQREYRLSAESIPDFYCDGIAIEIKVKGNAMKIYKQCERYCQHDSVKQLILITNRSMGFPHTLNGKPCYVLKIGNSWL